MLRMLSLDIGQYIGLPNKPNTDEFRRLTNLLEELNLTVNPITLISALLKDENEVGYIVFGVNKNLILSLIFLFHLLVLLK